MLVRALPPLLALVAAAPGPARGADAPRRSQPSATSEERRRAPEADGRGFLLSVRLGWGIPTGSLDQNTPLGWPLGGQIPLWLDAGYRFSDRITAAAYFQLAVVQGRGEQPAFSGSCETAGIRCTASSMRFGAELFYRIPVDAVLAPWVGVGAGYEIVRIGETVSLTSAQGGGEGSLDVTYRGFELVNVQAGGDYRLGRRAVVGPYAAFALGQYSSVTSSYQSMPLLGTGSRSVEIPGKSLHGWLQLGVRGTLEL